ncbi:hypothetical protein ACD591_08455 [Rufibacter glacialis]|uniref:Uncharacterized protein n=1 Tax=Rufibacter glacialis TaxID=1259555 RepID=A0A5M8QBK6_9BACT|nr:hypothetical protein [Rufibacter glacialis]KAA6432528.1 hypothetical protein FOE74_15650 [Rufibacter glacialis]
METAVRKVEAKFGGRVVWKGGRKGKIVQFLLGEGWEGGRSFLLSKIISSGFRGNFKKIPLKPEPTQTPGAKANGRAFYLKSEKR